MPKNYKESLTKTKQNKRYCRRISTPGRMLALKLLFFTGLIFRKWEMRGDNTPELLRPYVYATENL